MDTLLQFGKGGVFGGVRPNTKQLLPCAKATENNDNKQTKLTNIVMS